MFEFSGHLQSNSLDDVHIVVARVGGVRKRGKVAEEARYAEFGYGKCPY